MSNFKHIYNCLLDLQSDKQADSYTGNSYTIYQLILECGTRKLYQVEMVKNQSFTYLGMCKQTTVFHRSGEKLVNLPWHVMVCCKRHIMLKICALFCPVLINKLSCHPFWSVLVCFVNASSHVTCVLVVWLVFFFTLKEDITLLSTSQTRQTACLFKKPLTACACQLLF